MKKYIVLTEFADKNNISKHYKPGDELPGEFGEDRLTNIIKLGLAKVEDTEAGKGNGSGNGTGAGITVTDIDLKATANTILSQVKGFADVEKLNAYLAAEKAAEKPRATVVKAIEDRIAKVEDTEAGKTE
jgi:hypothetical protein